MNSRRRHTVRVLAIDDDVDYQMLIMEWLARSSDPEYHVGVTLDLRSAAEYFAPPKWDAIVLDLGLAESRGLETLHLARQMAPGVPIVVLTGSDEAELVVRAAIQGVHYLLKEETDGPALRSAVKFAVSHRPRWGAGWKPMSLRVSERVPLLMKSLAQPVSLRFPAVR